MSSTRFSGPWCVSRPWIFEGSNPKCCWKKCNSGPWPQPVMGLTVWVGEMEHVLFFLVPGVKKSWGSKQKKTNAASETGFSLMSFSECFNLKKLNSGFYQRRGSRFACFFVKTGHLKKKEPNKIPQTKAPTQRTSSEAFKAASCPTKAAKFLHASE